MKNYTTEEVNGLLDELYSKCNGNIQRNASYGHYEIKHTTLQQFKKYKGLLPDLELGFWYKDKNLSKYIAFFGLDGSCYGFDLNGRWFSVKHTSEHLKALLNNGTPNYNATPEEVEAALIAEAKKLKGKTLQNMYDSNKSLVFDDSFLIEYNHTDNRVYIRNSNYRDVYDIMSYGKWATIIEENKELKHDDIIYLTVSNSTTKTITIGECNNGTTTIKIK